MATDEGEGRTRHLPTDQQGVQQKVRVHEREGGAGLECRVQKVCHMQQFLKNVFRGSCKIWTHVIIVLLIN